MAFPAFLAINRTSANKIKVLFVRNKNVKPSIILCFAIALLAVTTATILASRYLIPDMPITPPSIITGIWLVFITPVIEEIMFRGVILQKLKKYGIIPAVVITTILFSVGHLDVGNMIVSFLPGILLAIVAIKTESIAYTIPLHMLVNLCGSIILPFALAM